MTALQNTGICIILDSGGCYLQNKYGTRLREGFCKVLRRGGEGALEIFPCSACLPAWLSSTCLRPGRQMNTLRGKPAAAVILRVLFPVGYLRNHSNTPTGIVTSFARAFFTRSRQKRVELHRGALRQSSYVLINGTDSGCLGATSAHGTPCQDRPNERQKAQKARDGLRAHMAVLSSPRSSPPPPLHPPPPPPPAGAGASAILSFGNLLGDAWASQVVVEASRGSRKFQGHRSFSRYPKLPVGDMAAPHRSFLSGSTNSQSQQPSEVRGSCTR